MRTGQASGGHPFVVMALVAVALTAWQHAALHRQAVSLPEYLAFRLTAPVETGLTRACGRIYALGMAAVGATSLVEENRRLREQLGELQAQQMVTVDVELQNKAFRAKLGLTPQVPFDKLAAEVIGRSSGGEGRWVRIRAAWGRALEVGNVVREARGLVGRVVEAQGSVGRVALLVDPTHAVRGQDLRSGDEGMVHAAPELAVAPNRLRMEKLRRGAQIQVGDTIVTSPLGETYPGRIPIGVVESVRGSPSTLGNLTAYIRPFVDFDRLDYVYVLRSGQR